MIWSKKTQHATSLRRGLPLPGRLQKIWATIVAIPEKNASDRLVLAGSGENTGAPCRPSPSSGHASLIAVSTRLTEKSRGFAPPGEAHFANTLSAVLQILLQSRTGLHYREH